MPAVQTDRNVFPRRHQGSGMGLFITKALVERHGRTLVIESGLGDGTTVRVRLPLATTGRAPWDRFRQLSSGWTFRMQGGVGRVSSGRLPAETCSSRGARLGQGSASWQQERQPGHAQEHSSILLLDASEPVSTPWRRAGRYCTGSPQHPRGVQQHISHFAFLLRRQVRAIAFQIWAIPPA